MIAGFIGAGKVGFSLGKYMVCNGITVSGYYSRNIDSAREAADFTHTDFFKNISEIVEKSDIIFLTVPDGAIEDVWKSLKQYSLENKYICHCSGAMSSAVFSGIDKCKAYGYSVHPLLAVCDKLQSYRDLSKAFFTIEYSNEKSFEKLDVIRNMITELGNQVMVIKDNQKTKYHAAAVFASNLVVSLVYEAAKLLQDCGFSEEDSRKALMPLFLNNCENISEKGPVMAITGPVERADDGTVRKHLSVLNQEESYIYAGLSKVLTEIASKKNPERDYEKIKKLLEEI